jgi:hypothetical protein
MPLSLNNRTPEGGLNDGDEGQDYSRSIIISMAKCCHAGLYLTARL